MKIVQINSTCGSGSTGKICVAVSKLLTENGIENYILYSAGNSEYALGKCYMSRLETKIQALQSRILGNYGFNSKAATRRMVQMLEEINPDIVHLHNLHGHNCDLQILFQYLREKKTKIFWTFHDCWAFTGYCPYYDMVGCDKWKTSCRNCPQKRKYSWFFDRSRYLFEKKKKLLENLDLTIITPSHWLAEQVKQSFLHKCEVKVIHNGIDLNVFQPRESSFREKYHCENKFIILGVAFIWAKRKGLDVFCELAKRLTEEYQIVLVGTDDEVDKILPPNIISIHHTQNQKELAQLYTTSDVFVNPARVDNYPTTHMEALACGTPVLTFQVGGCSEMLDENCGVAVPKDDVEAIFHEIISMHENKKMNISKDHVQKFDEKLKYEEYVALYQNANIQNR